MNKIILGNQNESAEKSKEKNAQKLDRAVKVDLKLNTVTDDYGASETKGEPLV